MSTGINETFRAEFEARLASGREGAAYRNYEHVRDWLLDLDRQSAGHTEKPSEYWTEELETLDYLLDASPLVIQKLRQHSYPVTGIRAYDYRRAKDPRPIREKLAALVELGGEELLVPESPALGGFGFEVEGALYNVDTLKYYEALIALERGAVLGAFAGDERRVVWEIGAGWGGFPYQFKSLFPNVTYIITDLPELFLFSATYLTTLFPEARTLLLDPSQRLSEAEADWLEYDFVFVPHTALEAVTPPRLDLTINMVSFQEMTAAQVERYVRTAHELGSPYVYSLNRERSLYNTELDSVSDIVGRYFWPRVVPVLPVSYAKMLNPRKAAKGGSTKERRRRDLDYKHVIATRRVET